MRYKALLFDLDGTLTDPKIGITTCCQYGLRAVGIDVPDLKDLEQFIGPPLVSAFMEVYGITEEQAMFALEKYRERFSVKGLYENEVIDGIPEMLEELKKTGVILATASSKPELFVRQIVEHFHLDQYFHEIIGAPMDERLANKEYVVSDAIRRLGLEDVNKDEILMIGDRLHDVEGAAKNGIKTVGVTFGYGSREELEKAGAARIVDSPEELLAFLLA